jgi:beta-lactamase regulating signal transducer with metallopeptidase domain
LPEDTANVFFLSKVTERELLSLIYSAEELNEYDENAPLVSPPVTARPNSNNNTPSQSDSDESDTPTPTAPTSSFPIPVGNIIIAVIAIGGVGGVLLFLKIRGKRNKIVADRDDDDYGNDDYDDED